MLAFRPIPLYGSVEKIPRQFVFPSISTFDECPMCFALVALPEKHYAWHVKQNPAETKLAESGQSSAGGGK